MLSQIEDMDVSNRAARARIQGLLVGADGETTCILAYPNKTLVDMRRQFVEEIYDLAENELGIPPNATYKVMRGDNAMFSRPLARDNAMLTQLADL